LRSEDLPFSLADLGDASLFDFFDPYVVGFAVQELLLPLMLLYLFSRLSLFRRVVTDTAVRPDEYRLPAVLGLIQLLVFAYRYALVEVMGDQVTLGVFVVIVAGLMGGWRVGLLLGILTMFLSGWMDYLGWMEPGELLNWRDYFEYAVLKNVTAVTAVWVGLAAGLAAEYLGDRRFNPKLAGLLALLIVAFVELMMLVVSEYPPDILIRFLPVVLMAGAATAVFAIMAQNVREEARREEVETAQLELTQANLALAETELALTQAELRALHAQINPHFFFNTLNTIRYFIRTDPNMARDLLVKLSEIFQRAMSAGEFVPLRDEIAYVVAYLALEKARLDDGLAGHWTTLAPELLDQPVPTLVLQPLVENAVIHGVSRAPEGETVHILIDRAGDDLLVQVTDDGPGFEAADAALSERLPEEVEVLAGKRPSIGLRNVDERLRKLYGDAYALTLDSEPGRGTRAAFKIPLERETAV
jgi:LytS/YehU family sensor histidine kinase